MKTLWRNSIAAGLSIVGLCVEANAQQYVDLATATASMEVIGLSSFKKTGHALTLGDVNGDNLADLIVGTTGVATGGLPRRGRIYVFFGKPAFSGLLDLNFASADLEIEATRSNTGLGTSVATGDINGDGIRDILIGEPDAETTVGAGVGIVSIFFGRQNFPRVLTEVESNIQIHGEATLDHFGEAIATGDFNHDNIMDAIVGVPLASPPNRANGGKVYIIYGRTMWPAKLDLSTTKADFTVWGASTTQFIANAVATEDLNLDGRADLIIGDFKANANGGVDAGKTFIILGNDSLNTMIDLAVRPADVTISGGNQQDHFGFSLATGDFDGDGDADLVVGARRANNFSNSDVGKAFVFLGTETWPREIDLTIEEAGFTLIGAPSLASSGSALAVGHFNGDSRADVLIGAPFASLEGRNQSGAAFVFAGRASTAVTVTLGADSSTAIVLGASGGHTLGNAVAAGDMNGDGIDEIVIAAEDAEPAGRIYVLSGDMITAIDNKETEALLPSSFALYQNYPNPFNAGTKITLDLPANAGEVEVAVFNLQGQKIVSLFSGRASQGRMELQWDGKDSWGRSMSSGVYFYAMKAGNSYATQKKLILLK